MSNRAAPPTDVRKPGAKKHPGGRPTSYRPEMGARLVGLMAEGRSLDGCAAALGVHPDRLYEWQHRYPEFAEAVRAGRAAATAFWEERLLDVAKGGAGNAQAIQWALRNRSRAAAGWHNDSQRVEHTGADGRPVEITAQFSSYDFGRLTREQRDALRELLLKAKGES